MSFKKITSTITIVPFITDYLNQCYKYEDDDIKKIIKDKIKTNPIHYRINKLDVYQRKDIIGYINGPEIVMFNNNDYTPYINEFIKDVLLKKNHYNKFVIFNNDVSNSDINYIMSNLIMQDVFEIEDIDIYEYTSSGTIENPLYISYVSRFDSD